MRVLVTVGSKRGGTEGLARSIVATLIESGHEALLRPAQTVEGLEEFDAVIVGGALYGNRWHRAARRFVERHVDELRDVPLWLFSSGPLDHSASESEIPPTRQVARIMARVGARSHVTFGGRLDADAKGFIAHAMVVQGRGGDFRDMDEARAWALGIADELGSLPSPVARTARPAARALRRALAGLCWFTGITATAGGLELMIGAEGTNRFPPIEILAGTPFTSYFIPGLLLAGVVGMVNCVAALLVSRRHRWGNLAGLGAGLTLLVWLLIEMAMLRSFHWLHALYLTLSVVVIALGALSSAHQRIRPRRRRVDIASTS